MKSMEQSQSNKPLILPRGYISWSQYDMWKKGKDRYIEEYMKGGRRLNTKELRFGKGIARMIETGEIKTILPDLIIYDKVEHKIKVSVNDVPLLGYIDSYDTEKNVFREYKTGKVPKNGKDPWDNVKIHKHGQLLFYAILLKNSINKMPQYCDLDWIETTESSPNPNDFWANVDKKIACTGKIKSFRRHFDTKELLMMEKDINRVANEISEAYYKFIREI